MIDLNRPPVRAGGLLLFADDEQPPVWHFVPERPAIELSESGQPAFLLIKYRTNPERDWPRGGGLLHLQCSLRLSPQALAEARTALIAGSGALQNIVPLQPDRVACELALWPGGSGGGAIPAAPAHNPPFGAAFEVALSIQGVTLFEQALRSGQSPATLTYRLTVNARRPSLPAKVTINFGHIDRESVPVSIQELIQDGTIRIEIPDPADSVATIDRVVEEVSHIVSTRLAADDSQSGTRTFDLRQPREEATVITASATIGELLGAVGSRGRIEAVVALMEEMRAG